MYVYIIIYIYICVYYASYFIGCRFNESDIFIGYSPNTKAAVVLQASVLVKKNSYSFSEGSPEWSEKVYLITSI